MLKFGKDSADETVRRFPGYILDSPPRYRHQTPENVPMRPAFPFVLVLVLWAVPPAAAAEMAKVVKTGGDFDVQIINSLPYVEGPAADPHKHKLDLYLPQGRRDFPVLFFVHGGAWRSGDRSWYPALGRVFAKNGIGVVVISYRLSPQVQHPAHIQDVARAFAWTVRNIGKYGGKVDEVFVSGHSAGGHLVALLATDESYLKAHNLSLTSIKGVIPLSGVYRIAPAGRLTEVAFGKDESLMRMASPIRHINGKHPPFLIIYADRDFPTCDTMSEDFCKALKKGACEATSLRVSSRNHITILVLAADEGDPTTQAMLEFIAKHSGLKLTARETR